MNYKSQIIRALSYPTLFIERDHVVNMKAELVNTQWSIPEREEFKQYVVQNKDDGISKAKNLSFERLSNVVSILKQNLDDYANGDGYTYYLKFFTKVKYNIDSIGDDVNYFIVPIIPQLDVNKRLKIIRAISEVYKDHVDLNVFMFFLLNDIFKRYTDEWMRNECISIVQDIIYKNQSRLILTIIDPLNSLLDSHDHNEFVKSLSHLIDEDTFSFLINDLSTDSIIDGTKCASNDTLRQQFATYVMNSSTKELTKLIKVSLINLKKDCNMEYAYLFKYNKRFLNVIIHEIKIRDENHPSIEKINNVMKLFNIKW